MFQIINKKEGYITLISVLVVGVISLSISASLLISGLNSTQIAMTNIKSKQVENLLNVCVEESLYEIREDASFIGVNTLSRGDGTCTYDVIDQGGENREIIISAQEDGIVKKVTININQIDPVIKISSWNETDFN